MPKTREWFKGTPGLTIGEIATLNTAARLVAGKSRELPCETLSKLQNAYRPGMSANDVIDATGLKTPPMGRWYQ